MTYTIMVAVDGRPEHRAALDWAATRAARDAARLELVYVIERSWGDSPDRPGRALELAARTLLEAERTIALRRMADFARRVTVPPSSASDAALPGGEQEVTAGFRYGHVGRELVRASAGADLLVIGTPSELDRQHAFSGSLAVRVAAAAECAVAVVPHGWEPRGRGVVVGVDGEPPAEAAVAFAADEAAALDEPLTVVCAGYVANPLLAGLVPEISLGDRRRQIVDAAREYALELDRGITVFAEVVETSPAPGIVAEADGSRMLVIGTRDRHGVQRVMLGSVGHDVLLNVRVPVVVVRTRNEALTRLHP
ncbi:universal stress protein [Leifsonia poae]|uniref:universal stress protein n=1 Tax=Leifsonia poae TaxID=110933 RepID=UPI003D6808D9